MGKMLILILVVVAGLSAVGALFVVATTDAVPSFALGSALTAQEQTVDKNAQAMVERGRDTFRFDTFGDETFWGDTLKLHRAIEGAGFGGVGAGVSPKTALAVGLKVDADKLPASLVQQIKAGKVDLDSPATTLALLRLNAVVGVKGFFADETPSRRAPGRLRSIGLTCAVCHSTVDNSFAPGIGHRLDGWPNRDLNVGVIVSLAPDLSVVTNLLGVDQTTVLKVLKSWGPGKFDAELFLDAKAFRPDGKSAAVLIPAAFGLAGVNLHTYTGWGSITYWNAFVANLEMHGRGTFFDPRLNDAQQFPIAAKAGFGNVRNGTDNVTAKLAALHFYQLAIPPPIPPPGSYNAAAAARGKRIFAMAKCSVCHVPPLFTEPGWNMHTPQEIGIDDFQASRAPDHRYRTTPLRGLFAREKGGFYHDGRFADLRAVIEHYKPVLGISLTPQDEDDLIEYLKSL